MMIVNIYIYIYIYKYIYIYMFAIRNIKFQIICKESNLINVTILKQYNNKE